MKEQVIISNLSESFGIEIRDHKDLKQAVNLIEEREGKQICFTIRKFLKRDEIIKLKEKIILERKLLL